jgi:hypothetical protein
MSLHREQTWARIRLEKARRDARDARVRVIKVAALALSLAVAVTLAWLAVRS